MCIFLPCLMFLLSLLQNSSAVLGSRKVSMELVVPRWIQLRRRLEGRWWVVLLLVLVMFESRSGNMVEGQQTYVNNHQLACYDDTYNTTTKGYVCNGLESTCLSYLTFRSLSPYTTPATVAYLLGAPQQTATLIASLNNISSDVASIPTNAQLVIPVNCSCFARQYYQHNATYTLKYPNETYFTVANNTYQGLSTCQALMAQNPSAYLNLTVGLNLEVPLRCACPTSNQTASGVKYLLTYMVTWGDSITSIARTFGVTQQSVLDANQLSSTSIIFPFTPILVPLTTEPTKIETTAASPPAAPSPQPPTIPGSSSDNKKWVFVGVGIGVVLLIVFLVFVLLFLYRRKPHRDQTIPTSEPKAQQSESTGYTAIPFSKSLSFSSYDVQHAIETLTLYKFSDLQTATAHFSQANRIKGSVYKGSFKGDIAAVKVLKGDVSSEINILKTINHSNIIRLSGFCIHEGNTYLVYEYAENGSLHDCLHSTKSESLSWKQRVQIAYDVADGLNYLHNYTNPPYIHKNLKASNILLDANLRGKMGNFGLARMLENDHDGGLQLTRHVIGTHGYMAPEYIENGIITPKLDVFAYGVVLLELLSGKEAVVYKDAGDELLSAIIVQVLEGNNVRENLHRFMDPGLREEYPLDLAFSMAHLAKACVLHDLNARPPMHQVFITLSKILSSSLDWDPSDDLQRSTSLNHGR